MGDDSFLKPTLSTYSSKCLRNAEKMEVLTLTNTTAFTGTEKPIVDVIAEAACPEDCSGNGVCKTGK